MPVQSLLSSAPDQSVSLNCKTWPLGKAEGMVNTPTRRLQPDDDAGLSSDPGTKGEVTVGSGHAVCRRVGHVFGRMCQTIRFLLKEKDCLLSNTKKSDRVTPPLTPEASVLPSCLTRAPRISQALVLAG